MPHGAGPLPRAVPGPWLAVRRYGPAGAGRRAIRRGIRVLEERLRLHELDFPLLPGDQEAAIAAAASVSTRGAATAPDPDRPELAGPPSGRPLRIGWVCVPPSAGSGGHTTFFRIAKAAAERGHECSVVLYEGGAVPDRERVLRAGWPWLGLPVLGMDSVGEADRFDVLVASSWPTAYAVAARREGALGVYFVQDYEPGFHPSGYLRHLASLSYHLGLELVALGDMVAQNLGAQERVRPELTVPFACDRSVYSPTPRVAGDPPRSGVVHYVRTRSDRRGHTLAVQTLRRFHELRPDQEIHLFGDRSSGWGIPVTQHGLLRPEDLNRLYNRTSAGLVLSFTNVSLVAAELLAAGNVPVLNEAADARLDHALHAIWAQPTADALATALVGVVDAVEPEVQAARAAAAAPGDWAETGLRFIRHVERVFQGQGRIAARPASTKEAGDVPA